MNLTIEIAKETLDACAKHFGGTWYLVATGFGWKRTTDKAEAELYGILHTAAA